MFHSQLMAMFCHTIVLEQVPVVLCCMLVYKFSCLQILLGLPSLLSFVVILVSKQCDSSLQNSHMLINDCSFVYLGAV